MTHNRVKSRLPPEAPFRKFRTFVFPNYNLLAIANVDKGQIQAPTATGAVSQIPDVS